MLSTLVVLTLFANGTAAPVSYHLDDGACQAAFRSIAAQRAADGIADRIGHSCSETVLAGSIQDAGYPGGVLAVIEAENRRISEAARLRDAFREADPNLKALAAVEMANLRIAERTRMRDTLREMDPATKAAVESLFLSRDGRE